MKRFFILIFKHNMVLKTYLFTLFCFVSINGDLFTLYKHSNTEYQSRCLDGSEAALYFAPGQQNDKFIIYFEGGGLCRGQGLAGLLQYCSQRAKTNLGSSKSYSALRSFQSNPTLSSNPQINPLFHNWNRIFVPYCDGSLHQGYSKQSIHYKNQQLFFRGQKNTLAHFNFLNKNHKLFDAKNIVLTGTSAGGMATYLWGNYVYHNSKYPQGVLLLPDSGIFITDFINPKTNKSMEYYTLSLFQIINTQTKMPVQQCVQRYPEQLGCFKAGNLAEFILPPIFLIQSSYDAWGLQQILELRCVGNQVPADISNCTDQQRVWIDQYRLKLVQGIKNFTSIERNSGWTISCVQHGFFQNDRSINNKDYVIQYPNGLTLLETLQKFINFGRINLFDDKQWPNNEGCNGKNKIKQRLFHLRAKNFISFRY